MPRKPEPKFIVKYVKNTRPIEEQKRLYKMFILHLVKVVKEQEALEKERKAKKK